MARCSDERGSLSSRYSKGGDLLGSQLQSIKILNSMACNRNAQ